MPLLRRLTNLRTEVATGRTRKGASSRARSSLVGRRKSQGWNGGLGGRKKLCSAYACPALRLLGTPRLPTRLGDSSIAIKKLRGLGGTCQAQSCNTMQNQAKSCHAKTMQKSCKTSYLVSSVYRDTDYTNSIFQRKPVRNKLPGHTCTDPEDARPTKKNWARKKRMASWARQRQQITEAADGGARARTGADGAVVLNLRRGPGAYALARGRAADPRGAALLLPPGPAAAQQELRQQPAPHPRGAQRLHPAAQRAEEARALPAGRAPADQAGQGFFRDKYYEYAPHGGAGGAAGQAAGGGLAGGGPILQLSDETYFLDPEGHWVVSASSARSHSAKRFGSRVSRQSVFTCAR